MTTYYCVVLIRPDINSLYFGVEKTICLENGKMATLLGVGSVNDKGDGYNVSDLSRKAGVLLTEDLNFAIHRMNQYNLAYASPTHSYHLLEFEYDG